MKHTATEAEKKAVLDAVFAPLEDEPPVRSSELVIPLALGVSELAEREILALWLSKESNTALLILKAFKIGLDQGHRERDNK